MFDDKFRPAGLEFAACDACHQGTRAMDQIVAMLSRIYPDPVTDAARHEAQLHIRGFINNYPDLAVLFTTDEDPELPYRGGTAYALDLKKQHRLQRAMKGFAARTGIALYREFSGGPLPSGGAVTARWYSNFELDSDQSVEKLLRELGNPRTLAMGRSNVVNQFRYWGGPAADDANLFVCFAAFRESFGVLAIVHVDGTEIAEHESVFRPGFLKGFEV